MTLTIALLTAFLLDLVIGDPRGCPHPIRYVGWLCAQAETTSRNRFTNEKIAGTVAFFTVITGTVLPLLVLLAIFHLSAPVIELIVATLFLYFGIACKDLIDHSRQVGSKLKGSPDLAAARNELSMIVGRDTAKLDHAGVIRACVETVAENLVDGVCAPIFFAILFGIVGGGELFSPAAMAVIGMYLYKAVNTMDSMYGYKNEQYVNFGRTAAKLDDALNYVPARLTGLLIVLVAYLLRLDGNSAWKIYSRDKNNHASPNAGHPEAAVAGALGIQLGGPATYFAEVIMKPYIGDRSREVELEDIRRVNSLMLVTSIVFTLCMLSLYHLIT